MRTYWYALAHSSDNSDLVMMKMKDNTAAQNTMMTRNFYKHANDIAM